jgi:hypothetical protein
MRKAAIVPIAALFGLAGCGDITVNNPPKRIIIEDKKVQPAIIEKTIVEKPIIIEKTVVEKPVVIEKTTIEKPIIIEKR